MRKRNLIIWSFLCALAVLLFTTRSSPLFVCNNWDDANSYFTMGKGLMNGLVIYRDLYDQKGPFLYLLYGLAYLISNRSFLGVFIFEILAATVFLYYSGLFVQRKSSAILAYAMLPVLGAAVYSSWSFYFGGAAEEFCLPFLAIALVHMDEILNDDCSDDGLKRSFGSVGLCTGVVAQVKYTMLGYFVAWFVIVVLWIVIKRGVLHGIKLALRYVFFAIIPSVPWFVYFLLTSSLDDWYRCYIYNNLFFYSQVTTEGYVFTQKIYEMSKTLYYLIQDSYSYFIWILLGFVLELIMEKGIIRKFTSIFLFACTYFVIFIGGNKLAYYSIPLMVLAVPGIAHAGGILKRIGDRWQLKLSVTSRLCLFAVVLALSVCFASFNTMNAEYRKFKPEEVWLVEASTMLSDHDTLLELNTVDPGLYTVTGIVPNCEYFQTNGINLETMFTEQKRYLKEGKTDYVLAVGFEPEGIYENYYLIKSFDYNETEHEEKYFLYKKN